MRFTEIIEQISSAEHKTYMQKESMNVETPTAKPSKIVNSREALEKYLRNRYGEGEIIVQDYKEYYKPYTYIATHISTRGDTNSHLIVPDKNGKYSIETIPHRDYPEVFKEVEETITPTVSGNTQQLSDPKLQAAQLAAQRQEKDLQKKNLQQQIQALQQQLRNLQQQQSNLNKTP